MSFVAKTCPACGMYIDHVCIPIDPEADRLADDLLREARNAKQTPIVDDQLAALAAERDKWKSARNECERQFQEKVAEISQLMDDADKLTAERDRLRETIQLVGNLRDETDEKATLLAAQLEVMTAERDALKHSNNNKEELLQQAFAHIGEACEMLGVDPNVTMADSWTLRTYCDKVRKERDEARKELESTRSLMKMLHAENVRDRTYAEQKNEEVARMKAALEKIRDEKDAHQHPYPDADMSNDVREEHRQIARDALGEK